MLVLPSSHSRKAAPGAANAGAKEKALEATPVTLQHLLKSASRVNSFITMAIGPRVVVGLFFLFNVAWWTWKP